MILRCCVILLALFCSLKAPFALGDDLPVHRDTANRYTIDIPKSFRFTPQGNPLGRYQGDQPLRMSVSRISYPSLPAWRKKQREAFIDQVVTGARKTTKGYRHKSQKAHRIGGVPGLDLHFAKTGESGPELVWIRFLFFRRFVIVAGASTASRLHQKLAKDFTRSLAPLRSP